MLGKIINLQSTKCETRTDRVVYVPQGRMKCLLMEHAYGSELQLYTSAEGGSTIRGMLLGKTKNSLNVARERNITVILV